jgi:hypothetical protein
VSFESEEMPSADAEITAEEEDHLAYEAIPEVVDTFSEEREKQESTEDGSLSDAPQTTGVTESAIVDCPLKAGADLRRLESQRRSVSASLTNHFETYINLCLNQHLNISMSKR